MAMSSTVASADEMTEDFQTEEYSTEAVTTAGQTLASPNVMLVSYKSVLIVFGVLGMLSNGLVLGGLWLPGRSKMTASSVYIANHTTLEQSPFSRPCPGLSVFFVTYISVGMSWINERLLSTSRLLSLL